jgi:hypothetical protein
MSPFHLYQKIPQTLPIPLQTLHQPLQVQPHWWERNLPQRLFGQFLLTKISLSRLSIYK